VPADGPRPLAVVYAANGYTHGQGSLVDAALEVAGFENLAARLGLTGVAQLPLEALLVAAPDVLILGVASEAWPALAGQILDHPALDDAFPESVRMILPESLWNCGTPVITDAIRRLARLRERVLRQAAVGRE
jgi:iron complex transport system substrate-binding protein